MTPRIQAIDHLVLTVSDLAQAIAFYSDVLGAQTEKFFVADGSSRWAIKIGQQKINLHEHCREFDPKARVPTPGSADLCFLSDTSLNHWVVHLDRLGIAIEEGPVARTGATGPILSIYVRDPDGNLLEISNSA